MSFRNRYLASQSFKPVSRGLEKSSMSGLNPENPPLFASWLIPPGSDEGCTYGMCPRLESTDTKNSSKGSYSSPENSHL